MTDPSLLEFKAKIREVLCPAVAKIIVCYKYESCVFLLYSLS